MARHGDHVPCGQLDAAVDLGRPAGASSACVLAALRPTVGSRSWSQGRLRRRRAAAADPHPVRPSQLERKRHIGNDIVVVVFTTDLDVVKSMEAFRSHQNRTFPETAGLHALPCVGRQRRLGRAGIAAWPGRRRAPQTLCSWWPRWATTATTRFACSASARCPSLSPCSRATASFSATARSSATCSTFYVRCCRGPARRACRKGVLTDGKLAQGGASAGRGRAVINAERSAYRAPVFANRIIKTRRSMLEDLVQTYVGDA